MGITATGRSRAVVAFGDFSGTSEIFLNTFNGVAPPKWEQNFLEIRVEFLGAVILFKTLLAVANVSERQLFLSCYTGPGLGNGNSDTDSLIEDVTAMENWEVDLTGSWSISYDSMEEVLIDTDTGDFPTYGGAKVPDAPGELWADFWDRTKEGNTLTVSASIGGMSVSASIVVTGSRIFYMQDYPLRISVIAEGRGKACSLIGVNNAVVQLGGENMTLTGGLSGSSATHSATIDAETGKVLLGCAATTKKTTATAVFYPKKRTQVHFGLRAMEHAYPGGVTLRMDKRPPDKLSEVQSIAHDSTLLIEQEQYEMNYAFWQRPGGGNETDPPDIDTPESDSSRRPTELISTGNNFINQNWKSLPGDAADGMRMWVDAGWNINNNEQPNDWRFLFFGRYNDSFDLSQAATMVVTSTLASGTGTGDLTIALPTATTAAGLQGTAFGACSMRGYRYLRLSMKASVAETVKVTIGGKEWLRDTAGNTLDLTTGYQDFMIDLCSPTNATDPEDGTDSFFPLPTADGAYWGVSSASSIVVGSISAGVTVDVASATLYRSSYSRATALHPYPMEWIPAGDTSDYPTRILDGDTDGRRSLEGIHFYRTPDEAQPDGYLYTVRSLSDLIFSINGAAAAFPTDGWSAAAETVFPDALHTNNLPACFAWGGGMMRVGSTWSFGFDLAAESSVTLPFQARWDRVSYTPYWGDGMFYAGGGYDETGVLAAGKILRGQAVGLVLGDDALPRSGITVSIDGGADGQGVTGADGSYQTGLPYPNGGSTATVQPDTGEPPLPSLSVTFPARKRKRACFRVIAPTEPIVGSCIEVDSPRAWLHIGVDKRIRTYNTITAALQFESEEYAIDAWKRLRVDSRRAILYGLAVSGDDFQVWVSEDGGLTATGVLAVTGRSAVIEVDSERGRVSLLWENEAGVYRQYSEDGGATWSDPDAVIYNDAPLDAILLDSDADKRYNGKIYLVAQDAVTFNIGVLGSEDLAETFTLLL